MGISRYYLEGHKFMLTKISGELNDKNLMQHVIDLNKETKEVLNLRELADLREIKSLEKLTVQGTVNCSKAEENRPESLLAILVPESNVVLYGMSRAYQMFSEDKRKDVQIFKDIYKALAWLSSDDYEILNNFVNNA